MTQQPQTDEEYVRAMLPGYLTMAADALRGIAEDVQAGKPVRIDQHDQALRSFAIVNWLPTLLYHAQYGEWPWARDCLGKVDGALKRIEEVSHA